MMEVPEFMRDLYEMANLFPASTGLPMTVWVTPKGRSRHDARVKVNKSYGNKTSLTNTVVVGIRPKPHMVAGRLVPQDEKSVFDWITLSADALIAYWDGQIDTRDLFQQLKSI